MHQRVARLRHTNHFPECRLKLVSEFEVPLFVLAQQAVRWKRLQAAIGTWGIVVATVVATAIDKAFDANAIKFRAFGGARSNRCPFASEEDLVRPRVANAHQHWTRVTGIVVTPEWLGSTSDNGSVWGGGRRESIKPA